MTDVAVFDPGKATGVAICHWGEQAPFEVVEKYIVPGGPAGFGNFIRPMHDLIGSDRIIYEKFIMRGGGPAVDLTGVQVEGVLLDWLSLEGYDLDRIVAQNRTHKHNVPDSILKAHGLWVTGKDVGWEDGRDANDAIIHGLYYAAFVEKHKPTLAKYFLMDTI